MYKVWQCRHSYLFGQSSLCCSVGLFGSCFICVGAKASRSAFYIHEILALHSTADWSRRSSTISPHGSSSVQFLRSIVPKPRSVLSRRGLHHFDAKIRLVEEFLGMWFSVEIGCIFDPMQRKMMTTASVGMYNIWCVILSRDVSKYFVRTAGRSWKEVKI